MTFSVSTTLEVGVDDSSLRSTRSQIEGELSDIQVGVDGGSVSSQLSRAVPDGGTAAAGGSAIGDKLDEQTELLTELNDTIEQSAVSGGGIGGGGGGGGVLGGLLPTGDGGGSGLISGLVGGGLALKAKDLLKVGGRLSLSAPQVLTIGTVLTLTAGSLIAVKERYEVPGRELLAVGSVLTIGAASLLAVGSVISVPAAALISVGAAITLGVSELVKLLPEGPGNVKTDGVTGSTRPGATPSGDGTDIDRGTAGDETANFFERAFGVDVPPRPSVGGGSDGSGSFRESLPRKVVVEVNESRDISVGINQGIKDALREAGFDPSEYEQIVREFRRLREGR